MKKALILFAILFISEMVNGQTIGLQLYSLRNQMPKDVAGTLALIKSWGITELEGGETYSLPIEEFKKLCSSNGFKMISVGADFTDLESNIQKVADKAKTFGAKYVVCFWIPHQGNDFTFADMEKAGKVFSNAGQALSKQGLRLCYHPHGYEFRPHKGGTLFDYLVKKTDARFFNFEMDVFWVKQAGISPASLLAKHPTRFLLMHLKDRQQGTPDSNDGHADVETNVVLGLGDVDIAAVMKEARKAGVKHFFIEDESSKSIQQIPQSFKYLQMLKY
jgi:sugar phosphate isomerase/epimerase